MSSGNLSKGKQNLTAKKCPRARKRSHDPKSERVGLDEAARMMCSSAV